MDVSTDTILCPECGYDLRASAGDRCPECGTVIDRSASGQSRIPWVHRRVIGRVRAYWGTVIMTTFRTKAMAREMSTVVSFSDARRFWQSTVLLFGCPLGVLAGIGVARINWKQWTAWPFGYPPGPFSPRLDLVVPYAIVAR